MVELRAQLPSALASDTSVSIGSTNLFDCLSVITRLALSAGHGITISPVANGSVLIQRAGQASQGSTDDSLSSKQVREILGFSDANRSGFWEMVKREKIPRVRISARNVRFPRVAFEDWMRRRAVGATKRPNRS